MQPAGLPGSIPALQQPVSYNPKPHLERRICAWLNESDPKAFAHYAKGNCGSESGARASCKPLAWLKNKFQKKSRDFSFMQLPPELRFLILTHLSAQHQKPWRAVSKETRAMIDDPRMGFWAKIEAAKTRSEIPQPILDMVGGLEAFLKLPVLDFSRKGPSVFSGNAARVFEPVSPSKRRVRALKPEEVPVFPARFIDQAGRWGLILGFKAGPQHKSIVQTLHEEKPRFAHQGQVTWLPGNSTDAPPPPLNEDMEFIGDEMRPCTSIRFMNEIRQNGRAEASHELFDTNRTISFSYMPTAQNPLS